MAAAFRVGTVFAGIAADAAASHGERALVRDAAATVIGCVTRNIDIGQVCRTSLIDKTTAITAIATCQGAVREVERSTFAHGDDLSAGVVFTGFESAVQCMPVKVDGHWASFDFQRLVAELDVVGQLDACTVFDGTAQLLVVRH